MAKHTTISVSIGSTESYLTATIIFLTLLRPSVAKISNRKASDINTSLVKFGIIPDLLKKPPPHVIKATYSFGHSPNFGNKIEAQFLKSNPYAILWPFEGSQFYTLLLVDLDAPSPKSPIKREWLHFLLGNIPGPAISQGEILAPYIRPNPEEGTHRLVFLVYKQPQGRVNFQERKLQYTTDPARAYFSSKNFAIKYNFGDPFACNFFLVDAPKRLSVDSPAENSTNLGEKIGENNVKPTSTIFQHEKSTGKRGAKSISTVSLTEKSTILKGNYGRRNNKPTPTILPAQNRTNLRGSFKKSSSESMPTYSPAEISTTLRGRYERISTKLTSTIIPTAESSTTLRDKFKETSDKSTLTKGPTANSIAVSERYDRISAKSTSAIISMNENRTTASNCFRISSPKSTSTISPAKNRITVRARYERSSEKPVLRRTQPVEDSSKIEIGYIW
ncbi:uncharacterized protein [Bemisia tabaci]